MLPVLSADDARFGDGVLRRSRDPTDAQTYEVVMKFIEPGQRTRRPPLPTPNDPMDGRYRPNAGAVLHRGDGLILIAERIERDGIWQFPQGGVEDGESREQAMWRELGEELGLERPRGLCELVAVGPETRYYFPQNADWAMADRYRGQQQTLFLVDYYGSDDHIRLDRHDRPEFRRYRWVSPTEALSMVPRTKRNILWQSLFAWLDLLGHAA
jgi:putative (di)nucleoside polyphosphate hydrolase